MFHLSLSCCQEIAQILSYTVVKMQIQNGAGAGEGLSQYPLSDNIIRIFATLQVFIHLILLTANTGFVHHYNELYSQVTAFVCTGDQLNLWLVISS